MPVPISEIVSVQITREIQSVTQAGFGTPLILGVNSIGWGDERVRVYSNIEEVGEDFQTSDEEYIAANAIFAQSPRIPQIKIGREDPRVAQVQTLTFDAPLIAGNNIDGQIDGVAIATVPFNTDNATTLSNLAAVIQAFPQIATAVSNGADTITITSANAGVPFILDLFVVTGGLTQAIITDAVTVANHGIANDLNEIEDEDSDWYGLIWTERDPDQVYEAATAIESRRKIFGTCSNDVNILSDISTTDIAARLFDGNFNRTFIIYHSDPTSFPDAAWMGRMFTYDPGQATWNFKTLATITSDDLTSSQRQSIRNKNCNMYINIGGNDMTSAGTMSSGALAVPRFIDSTRGIDWLQARIEERIFARLTSLPKVPFTNGGIAIIETELRAVLLSAIGQGVLSGDALDPDNDVNVPFTVSLPKAIDVDPTTRANRILPDVNFIAREAGAIHQIIIDGVVSI